jgi:hypothetical protein
MITSTQFRSVSWTSGRRCVHPDERKRAGRGPESVLRTAALAALLLAGALASAGAAEAGTINLTTDTGATTGYTGSYTNAGGASIAGGEFGVTAYDGSFASMAANVKVGDNLFQTFSVEADQNVRLILPVNWASSETAHPGGGGAVAASDPLSAQTAYLFTQFWNGTLSSYHFGTGTDRMTSATQLQRAIWSLEGESLGTGIASGSQEDLWIQEANSHTSSGGDWFAAYGANGTGDVHVLTLTTLLSGGALQDVLVFTGAGVGTTSVSAVPLPSAATMGLALASAIGLIVALRRRRSADQSAF